MVGRLYWIGIVFLFFLEGKAQQLTIKVKNNLSFDRTEVVTVEEHFLKKYLSKHHQEEITITDEKDNLIPFQWVDYEDYGLADELLFLAKVPANTTVQYKLTEHTKEKTPKPENVTFSRFVPERSDDYAWENDKVAFRTYGPKAQEEALKGVAGSTLSSGIDIWLKRTNQPIINKWYKKNLEAPGYYHADHGEGYDPYHVGAGRGVGGTGIWVNDSLQVSQNFMGHKTIASGPLRTIFELTYAAWSEFGLKETKRISLDLNSNFSRVEVRFDTGKPIPNFAVGISTHENKGQTKIEALKGWFRYWEKIDDAFVGTGIVLGSEVVITAFANVSPLRDQGNIIITTNASRKLVYYLGFAWQKSGEISTVEDWDAMLQKQAAIIANPLEVQVK